MRDMRYTIAMNVQVIYAYLYYPQIYSLLPIYIAEN